MEQAFHYKEYCHNPALSQHRPLNPHLPHSHHPQQHHPNHTQHHPHHPQQHHSQGPLQASSSSQQPPHLPPQHQQQQQQQPHKGTGASASNGAAAASGQTGRDEFSGLDNDALDFSQLEDFIANETDANGSYFADTLANNEASKHAAVTPTTQTSRDRILVITTTSVPQTDNGIYVGGKSGPPGANSRPNGYPPGSLPHNLPDSPPDSGSEPPYSPTDPGSRSPNHKGNVNGRRQLHDLLVHPIYTTSQPHAATTATNILPLIQHDLQSLESPLPHIAPIHVPPLIPISPTAAGTSVESPAGNSTLTTLEGNHVVNDSSQAPPCQSTSSQSSSVQQGQGGHPETLVPFYTQLTPIHAAHSTTATPATETPVQPPVTATTGRGGRKRKSSGSGASGNGKMVHVKQEPGFVAEMSPSDSNCSNNNASNGNNGGGSQVDDEYGFDFSGDPSMFLDSNYQCIKFQSFQENTWHTLTDESFKELAMPYYKVDADKGFNFSNSDDAFVCQKKNHFQITCHTRVAGEPKYVKTADGYKPIENFYIHFYGVKVESPNQVIKIEQSQSDRSKKPFHPVLMELNGDQISKVTVGRLHFNETTSNNMRKKGKPNPDQRYFYLVVSLNAHCTDGGSYPIVAHSSQRIIVRASNPGQFESDMELSWQKGHTSDSIYHAGRVGINTDRPEEALVVYGNCKITGQITHPSDSRAKRDISELDTKEQLKNVQQLRVVRYKYNPEFAKMLGLAEDEAMDTGVIAQEVRKILPEAVKETGDIELPNGQKIDNFLVVNKERIFMENIGAVKELCKVTGKLETRIDQLEKITQIQRTDSHSTSNSDSTRKRRTRTSESRMRNISELLCSNRCVQLLIVVLVLIMAFCLVAMATLYILEYHKRSSFEYYHNSRHMFNSSHAYINHPGSPYMNDVFPHSPLRPDQTTLMSSNHFHSPSTLHSYTQSTKPSKVPAKAATPSIVKNVLYSPPQPIVKPLVLGRPDHCPATVAYSNSPCKTYCCPGTNLEETPVDYSEIEKRNHVALTGAFWPQHRSPSSNAVTETIGVNNNTVDTVSASPTNNAVNKNGLEFKKRRRRQINKDTPKLITVPLIRILSENINKSLDSSYCMVNSEGYHDCVSMENRYFSGVNLTYHVPLSKYWDELNLSLIFNFSSKFEISKPQVCSEYYSQPDCRFDGADGNNESEKPSSSSVSTDSFVIGVNGNNVFSVSLHVGTSPYSRISIRFSPNIDDYENLCLPNDVRSKFFEFNFHFYRVCDE